MVDSKRKGRILILELKEDLPILKAIASKIGVQILEVLTTEGKNVNEISRILNLPQSTVATNVMALERAGLIETKTQRAARGTQKICYPIYEEYIVKFSEPKTAEDDMIEVEMPVGLFIQYEVSAPCGMCSPEKIIGYLDSPASFLEPERVKAGLLWFEKGFVEYQFPNNALSRTKTPKKLEIVMELSSEVPGTNPKWLSDITVWVNNQDIGTWTSPGDFGDKRGIYTPKWWKLEGSQYGLQKSFSVSGEGSSVDGVRVSDIRLSDLRLPDHHSIRVKVGIKENAENIGGINIFGRGFGNYDHDIILRLYF
jgi:predicted transcriptional regulator